MLIMKSLLLLLAMAGQLYMFKFQGSIKDYYFISLTVEQNGVRCDEE